MAPPQSDAFVKAQTEVKQLTKPLDNDQLLQLYVLYKIGTASPVEEGGLFSPTQKFKHSAWKKYTEEHGEDAAAAQEKYVALVEELKVSHDFDPNKTPEAVKK